MEREREKETKQSKQKVARGINAKTLSGRGTKSIYFPPRDAELLLLPPLLPLL